MTKQRKLAVFTVTFSYDPDEVDDSDENLNKICDEIEDKMDDMMCVLETEFEKVPLLVEYTS